MLFIFTAGKQEARNHIDSSISSPVALATIQPHLSDEETSTINNIMKDYGDLYAWGAVPGKSNNRNWGAMSFGDHVLCVYDNYYHYYARVAGKIHNNAVAKSIWGTKSNGDTWELMYFLTKPQKIYCSVEEVSDYLHTLYFGFTRISDKRIACISEDIGSIEKFIKIRLLSDLSYK